MDEFYISTLGNYISILERLKKQYYSYGRPSAVTNIYRGLSDKEYLLLPSLFRTQDDRYNFDEINPEYVANDRYLSYGNEQTILKSFIHEASRYVNLPSNELLRWAEYAQHYGVPTRLLDWTSNPLVALYFACKNNLEKDGKVWLLHLKNYDRIRHALQPNVFWDLTKYDAIDAMKELLDGKVEQKYPIVYTPYYVDNRMSAQSSFFMCWGSVKKPFEELFSDKKYQMVLPEDDPKERIFGKHEDEALLFCFYIDADSKPFILRELDIVGVNEKSVFPGLDGIWRYVEQKFRFNYNEYVSSL